MKSSAVTVVIIMAVASVGGFAALAMDGGSTPAGPVDEFVEPPSRLFIASPDLNLSADPNIAYVDDLVWMGWVETIVNATDGGMYEVMAQGFAPNGTPMTEEVSVYRATHGMGGLQMAGDPTGRLHFAWYDAEDAEEIAYAQLLHGEVSVPRTLLQSGPDRSLTPTIAADSDGNAHIMWFESHGVRAAGVFNWDIHYAKVGPDGTVLINDRQLTDYHTKSTGIPQVAVAPDGTVWGAWIMHSPTLFNNEVHVMHLTNDGIRIGPDSRLSFRRWGPFHLDLCAEEDRVHVVWEEDGYRDSLANEIMYAEVGSISGLLLGQPTLLTNTQENEQDPVIACHGGERTLVWRVGNEMLWTEFSEPGDISGKPVPGLVGPITGQVPSIVAGPNGMSYIGYGTIWPPPDANGNQTANETAGTLAWTSIP